MLVNRNKEQEQNSVFKAKHWDREIDYTVDKALVLHMVNQGLIPSTTYGF